MSEQSYKCPYCNQLLSLHAGTFVARYTSFQYPNEGASVPLTFSDSCIKTNFVKCPNCEQYSIYGEGVGNAVKDITFRIKPKSAAIQFPDYVPDQIRNDYEEACAVLDLSPKASATLSRRCLQGMIRDFWDIKKSRLCDEIDALEEKVPAAQWSAINRVRQLGNIGAHMEKDVNLLIDIKPSEANTLIKLIELLLRQWYIERHDQQTLYNEIECIYEAKESLKH